MEKTYYSNVAITRRIKDYTYINTFKCNVNSELRITLKIMKKRQRNIVIESGRSK